MTHADYVALVIERVFAITYLVLGLSMLAYASRWRDWYDSTARKPGAAIKFGAIALLAGAVIIAGHNHWMSFPAGLLTVLGWIAIAKGLLLLLAPEFLDWWMRRIGIQLWTVMLGGAIAVALALIVGWQAFLRA